MQLYNSSISLSETKSINCKNTTRTYKFSNNQDREIALYLKEDSFVFVVSDVLSFECFIQTDEVFYQLHKQGNQKLLKYWFSHTLLPIYFTMTNKYYFLHAGAVRVDEKTILFMADSMGGKSTTTDYFLKKGHTLVSDDKVGTFLQNGKFMLVSSYPYHRPYRKFEDLGIKVDNFEENITHLDVIYALDIDSRHNKVEIMELKGIEKVSLLIRGTDIGLPFFKKERFEHITKLANATPVFRIHIPKELSRLDEVYTQIIKHTKRVGE